MAVLETSAICSVKVENEEIKHNVSSVRLEQYIDNHHGLAVRVKQAGKAEGGKEFDDPSTFTSFLGKSISIVITPAGELVDASRQLEFIGLVTEVSLDHSIDGVNTFLIRAESPTITLDGSRRNMYYSNKSVSDIISGILQSYPITVGEVASTKGTFKFDAQYMETDYEYILRLAAAQSLFAYYTGKEFCVTKAVSGDPEELVWRETLGSFRLGLGTTPYNYESKVYNYEEAKTYSQDTTGLKPEVAPSELVNISYESSKKIYDKAGFSTSPKAATDRQSLENTLKTEKCRSLGSMVKCYGQSNVPQVTIGRCVKVKGMDKLDGLYWVKGINHIFDESGKYHNTFICTPVDAAYPEKEAVQKVADDIDTVKAEVPSRKKFKPAEFKGLHVAVVVDNVDPESMGRIKVKYPWTDDEIVKWVRLAVPYAGGDRGWISLPEIDDEVLIGYEYGDPDHPIALGALYNGQAMPPADAGGDKNDIKMLMTRGGNQIIFNDEDGKEEIRITNKDGKNSIVMEVSGPSISFESSGDISIKGNNITIESQQEIKLKAGSDLKAESSANTTIEAGANLKSKGGAMVNLEGATVTVKGNPIQLN